MGKFNLEAVIVNGGVVVVALTIFWGGFVYLYNVESCRAWGRTEKAKLGV